MPFSSLAKLASVDGLSKEHFELIETVVLEKLQANSDLKLQLTDVQPLAIIVDALSKHDLLTPSFIGLVVQYFSNSIQYLPLELVPGLYLSLSKVIHIYTQSSEQSTF